MYRIDFHFMPTVARFTTSLLALSLLMLSIGSAWADKPPVADPLSSEQWASVEAQIEAHRHRVVPAAGGGFRAHNPDLGLAQHYHPNGRTQIQGQHLDASLRLKAFGYENMIETHEPALRAEADGQGWVMHYQWNQNLREWWQNRPGVLEQWFELQHRPSGANGSPLRLQMALEVPEDTPVHLDATGQALRIGEGEHALHYAGLKVWDADGNVLPARMQLSPAGDLLLAIEDAGARYPVTIDPGWSQEAYFKASNVEAGDRFGYSIALSGDTLVVGAPFEDSSASGVGGDQLNNDEASSGAAYVFVRYGGVWTQQAYLKASNSGRGDKFGYSVAVSGDTLVVGAPGERSSATGINGPQFLDGPADVGAAYVFVRSGTTWTQQAYIKASNSQGLDEFGHAVALSGDLLVVGAPYEDSNATGVDGDGDNDNAKDSGAAYVFFRNGAKWFHVAYLKASNSGAGDQFGKAVAIDGTSVAVGAAFEDSEANNAADSGAVYVFQRGATVTSWSQQAYLKASNAEANDRFGSSAAISGDTLVAGAPGEASNAKGVNGDQNNNSAAGSGAAYVFRRSGATWGQQAYLKASNTEADDDFGTAVAISGNLIVVGAPGEGSSATGINGDQLNNLMQYSGAAYGFVRSGADWSPQAYVKASNTDVASAFGSALAVSGDTLVVGSPNEGSPGIGVNGIQGPNDGAVASGSAYALRIRPTIGGTLAGLASGSVTLQTYGPVSLVLSDNGPFTFAAPLAFEGQYNVTVSTQPPGQICTVANGSGVALDEVNDIQVNCAVGAFTVGGNITGLAAGKTVTLRNNGETLERSANGAFSFNTLYGKGNTYNVTVSSQPEGQTCTVANGAGTVNGKISNIQISCTANFYTIGGTMLGLNAGESITLRSNLGDELVLDANGSFAFATPILHGYSYSVTVISQPAGRSCSVANGSGTALNNVTNVTVACNTLRYTIGGTISGLAAGNSVSLNLLGSTVFGNNGSFTFPYTFTYGAPYTVSISAQPVGQTCTVINGSGTILANVTNIEVSCVINSYTIGGTLSGLATGESITLQNSGGDDLVRTVNGAFVFPTRVLHRGAYAVTVANAPAGQICLISNGSGTVNGTNVSNINIQCFTGQPVVVGGSVTGLPAEGCYGQKCMGLRNNGGEYLFIYGNGPFVFPTKISVGDAYEVTVLYHSFQQTCTVSNGTGVATGDVNDVAVECIDGLTIGGELSGLGANRSITLQNTLQKHDYTDLNNVVVVDYPAEDLVLDANGRFTFPTPTEMLDNIDSFITYNVTVAGQPPGQACTVLNGEGLLGVFDGPVVNVQVNCTTFAYFVGGTVSGLAAGKSVVLQNNGGDDLTVSANGAFSFNTLFGNGDSYNVTVSSQPEGQTCTVINGSGTVLADVTNVEVSCVTNSYAITATANPSAGGTVSCDVNPVSHGGRSICTASTNTGYTFTGFSGDCSGATCDLSNVTAARSVTANFSLNEYAVTASADPVEGGSVTCTPDPVPHGSDSTCTASANTGYTFTGFSGDCSGTTCTLSNVTAARSVTANFSLNHYAVTASADPLEGGSVTCTPDPVPHGSDSTCTASANTGYTFTGFSGDCSGTTCTLSDVTAARNVTANFSLNHYAVTASADPLEGGSVTCTPDPVPHNSATTCTLTPADGFRAADTVGGTCPAGTWQDATTYRVEAITAACSLNFAFVLDGACGDAAATPALTAPAGGLCAFGSPGPVTSADGTHAWSCAGGFGGSDAQCSAPGAAPGAYPGNTVTLEVEAGDGCTLDSAQLIDPPGSLPTGVELPYGAVDFTLSGCTSATVTLTHAGPVETQAFWKYVHGRWVDRMPVTLSGNQVQFTLTDGSYWDSDPRTGFIADPGGVGSALAIVPTLGPWALGLLAGLLGALGLRRKIQLVRAGQ